MKHPEVDTYCQQHGFTDPFLHEGLWWAFPPNAVMPVPLDRQHIFETAFRNAIQFDPEPQFRRALQNGFTLDAKAIRRAFQEAQTGKVFTPQDFAHDL